jgi:hypothetical protein
MQLALLVAPFAEATVGQAAHAFPPFERWISQKAGFQTDCAYCHVNPAGPSGHGVGQEGRLDERQKQHLHSADSPILNSFGQHLLKTLSYDKVVSSVSDPGSLAVQMKGYDLDGDGVSDGEEMEHGTLAYDPLSAPPALVWMERLKQNWSFVVTLAVSSLAGAAGLFFLAMERKDAAK